MGQSTIPSLQSGRAKSAGFVFLKFTDLKWLKMQLNCPQWLEKILKYILISNGQFSVFSADYYINRYLMLMQKKPKSCIATNK